MSFFGVGNPFSTPVGQKIGKIINIYNSLEPSEISSYRTLWSISFCCALENPNFSLLWCNDNSALSNFTVIAIVLLYLWDRRFALRFIKQVLITLTLLLWYAWWKIVSEQATDGSLPSENWALNMEICDIINSTPDGPKDAIKAIRKRLTQSAGKNYTIVMYTLTVLETCVKNCGKSFHVLVCSKEFISELVSQDVFTKKFSIIILKQSRQ